MAFLPAAGALGAEMVLPAEIGNFVAAATPWVEKAMIADAAWQQSRPMRARMGSYGKALRKALRPLARGMSKSKAGGKVYGKKGKRKLPPPTTSTKRARYSSSGGVVALGRRRFSKGKRPRKVSRFVCTEKTQSQQISVSNANQAGWLGFQHHDSRDALLRAACDAVVQAILGVMKIHPTSQYDTFDIDGLRAGDTCKVDVMLQKVNADTGEDTLSSAHTINLSHGNDNSFHAMADALYTSVRTDILDNGYYFYDFHVYMQNNTLGALWLHRKVDLSNAQFMLYVNQRVDLQNQTKAASSGTDEDVANRLNIHSQPLQGKMYTFAHANADVHDMIHQTGGSGLDFFEDTTPEALGHKGVSMKISSSTFTGKPIPARALFKNCKKEANVGLGPGEVKKLTTQFKFKGSLSTFCKKIGNVGNVSKNGYGALTFFCLERSIKHGTTAMEVAFQRTLKIGSYCKLRATRHTMRRIETDT